MWLPADWRKWILDYFVVTLARFLLIFANVTALSPSPTLDTLQQNTGRFVVGILWQESRRDPSRTEMDTSLALSSLPKRREATGNNTFHSYPLSKAHSTPLTFFDRVLMLYLPR